MDMDSDIEIRKRQKILKSIGQAMLCVAYCDESLDRAEEVVLEKFADKHNLKISLKDKKTLSRINIEDTLAATERAIKLISKLSAVKEREKFLFIMLEELQKIAEADEVFHESERRIIKFVAHKTGQKLSLSGIKEKVWTDSQLKILDSPESEKMIVYAPPGAGKTECVAEKVLRLIEKGVSPQNIVLISFTRNAVREMEDRIAIKTHDGIYPYGIKVLTLDSQAHIQNSSLYSEWKFPQRYEDSLLAFLKLLDDENFDLLEDWQETKHFFIDEAQDICGLRRKICMKLIDIASEDCGITVLGDPAQAIYDWTGENDSDSLNLMQSIDKELDFETIELQSIHRTSDNKLLKIIDRLREDIILVGEYDDNPSIKNHTSTIGYTDDEFFDEIEDSTDNYLFLFRTNKEVGNAAHRFEVAGQNFRINEGAKKKFGKYFPVWIYNILDYCEENELNELTFNQFQEIHQSLPASTYMIFDNHKLLWSRLMRNAGSGNDRISINYFRELLHPSDGVSPPSVFQNKYFGRSGPILSTVHKAKGSQAKHIMLGDQGVGKGRGGLNLDLDRFTNLDDLKVIFVALLRGSHSVSRSTSMGYFTRTIYSEGEKVCNKHAIGVKNGKLERLVRKYVTNSRRKAQPTFGIEVGLNGDYDPLSIVSNTLKLSDVEELQNLLLSGRFLNSDYDCFARRNIYGQYNLNLDFEGKTYRLGKFTSQVYDNITNFIKFQKTKPGIEPPTDIHGLRIMDIATFVSSPEDLEDSEILTKFKNRGFWVYPKIYGSGPYAGKKT